MLQALVCCCTDYSPFFVDNYSLKMMVLTVLPLWIIAASAGVVFHSRCGGEGTMWQMRIEECEGDIAYMNPGQIYPCEGDIIPNSPCAALRLNVSTTYLGFPVNIIDQLLPNSSVEPGVQYIIRFNIIPNHLLSGNTLPITVEIICDAVDRIEICAALSAHIN